MNLALAEARKAGTIGEVPVGAVLVKDGKVISRAHNLTRKLSDPTCHAEILALKKGTGKLKNERLTGTTIYVTVEPCPMCAGALVWSRVKRLVYGAGDPKSGAAGSVINIVKNRKFNHRMEKTKGVRETEARQLMREFFRSRRAKTPK